MDEINILNNQLSRIRAMNRYYHNQFLIDVRIFFITTCMFYYLSFTNSNVYAVIPFISLFGSVVLSFHAHYLIFSRNSLISSIPRFEAPSISITSIDLPSIICLITSDSTSYLIDGLSDPFKHIASNLAAVVLPTPLGPANKKACAIRFFSKALIKVFVI